MGGDLDESLGVVPQNLPDKYWRVTANSDTCEGRGPCFDTPFAFYSEAEALKFAQSKYYANKYGVMGTPGSKYDIREVKTRIKIFRTCDEALEEVSDEAVRTRALAKLTSEEIRVLGLKR